MLSRCLLLALLFKAWGQNLCAASVVSRGLSWPSHSQHSLSHSHSTQSLSNKLSQKHSQRSHAQHVRGISLQPRMFLRMILRKAFAKRCANTYFKSSSIYVYIYIYIYVYLYIYVYYVHIYIYIYTSYISIYICIYKYKYKYRYIYPYNSIY